MNIKTFYQSLLFSYYNWSSLNFVFLQTSSLSFYTFQTLNNPATRYSFSIFFMENNIDIPQCLIENRINTKYLPHKLLNLFFHKGHKEKQLVYFIKAFNFFFTNHKHYFINQFNVNKTSLVLNMWIFSQYQTTRLDSFSTLSNNVSPVSLLLNTINNHKPLFHFFIFNVSKSLKKFSRGKAGKYTFVWKFLPVYKRLFCAFKIFSKEIKFVSSMKIFQKMYIIINRLLTKPNESFLVKTKKFTANYVFKNFRKSLLTSLTLVR